MVKAILLSLAFLLSSIGVILLFMYDPDLGSILSYLILIVVMIGTIGLWFVLVSGVWSWMLPRAVLSVDGLVISIRYSQFSRGERIILTGRTSDDTLMKVACAPIDEPIERVLGERSVNDPKGYPATLQIEDEVFEFPMSKSSVHWRDRGSNYSVVTRYSGYFYLVKGPVHFVGEVRHSIVHELETSEIITMNQNS